VSPTFIASAWTTAPIAYGSTMAYMFLSSISMPRIRIMSSWMA
jgi:hypothetical protein